MPCSSAQAACLPGLLRPSRLRQGMKCIKTWMWKVGEAIQLKEGENTKRVVGRRWNRVQRSESGAIVRARLRPGP